MLIIINLTDEVAAVVVKRRNGDVIPFLIDREDVPKVEQFDWSYHFGYCCRRNAQGKDVNITSLLCPPLKKGEVYYYKNGDRRNNRKENLGITTLSLKNYHQKVQCNSGTKRRRVYHADGSFVALVGFGGKRKSFKTFEEAVAAREEFEKTIAAVQKTTWYKGTTNCCKKRTGTNEKDD